MIDMREIKFRGKDKMTGKWVVGDFIHSQKITRTGLEPRVMVSGYEVDENTVGQFTGLFDVDLKEIYEGDIVEWTFFKYGETEYEYLLVGVIAWAQGGMIFRVIKNDFEDAGYYAISSLYTDTESDCKVLGNIHDQKLEDFK